MVQEKIYIHTEFTIQCKGALIALLSFKKGNVDKEIISGSRGVLCGYYETMLTVCNYFKFVV